MDSKDYLRKMIDHTVNGDKEAAEQAFKDYLIPKTQEILGTNKPVTPEAPEVPEVAPEPEEPGTTEE